MNDLAVIVKEFGFPALVCLGLAYFIMYLMKSHKEERKEDRDERKQSNEKLANAIESLEEHIKHR